MSAEVWLGLGTVLVGAAGVGTYVYFERRKKSEPQVNARNGHAVQGTGNIVVGNVHVTMPEREARPRVPETPAPTAPPPATPFSKPVVAHVEKDPHVCDTGPFRVRAGELQRIELDVRAGDVVEGKLDGDADFDYDIVNEKNYVAMRRGDDFTAADYGENEPAYGIRWRVKGKGPWFLVLSAPRRQYQRCVHVYLRKS